MSPHATTSAPPSRSEARDLFRLFDDLPTGVLLLDTEGCVLRVNELAAARLGREETEMVGLDLFREAFPALEQLRVGERFRCAIRDAEVNLDWHGTLGTPRGERVLWFGFRSFEFRQVTWGIVVVEDRTALVTEETRRKRAERLAAVGELAAGVAHEVNNPLASIRSFAQLLLRDARGGEQQRALEIIVQECVRIARVVEDLLHFARQQGASGREPVNLSLVVARVLELQRYALETAGIEVRADLDFGLSPVMGEPGALQQVVLNLIDNAEQALMQRSGERLLVVRTRESSEGVRLAVVDNGVGIQRDRLPHIFDAYGEMGPTQPGLGLGVCATIIREHGGHIAAESDEGRGTGIFVRLPRATVPLVARAPEPTDEAPTTASPPPRPLRVLIADDEPTLRLAISLFLGHRGHLVTQAANAYEALRVAQEEDFDVALVDARMPGDGLDLLEKLEAMPSLSGRTALMTGDLGRARTGQGIVTGRPYLVKPFDMNEAVTLIERLGQ